MDKQKIRANREKVRSNIKKISSLFSGPLNLTKVPESEEKESMGVRRRRKTSFNIKTFDTLHVFKEKSVNRDFEDLFVMGPELGQGAHSVVYRCTEISTGIEYAVKVCKKKDPELLENMRTTYNVMKELNHQSIAQGKYFYLDEKKITCRIVTQFFQFPNLRQFMKLRKKTPLQEEEVANIMNAILLCLAYLSLKKVCHRDIKPQNILYNPVSNQIKIIDFQLARMQRYSHQKLQLLSNTGTLHYRAPQTFKGAYGIPVDTWSAGVIAFELLTGQLPFRSSYEKQTVDKICNQVLDLEKFDISASAKNFLRKLLQKNPQNRISAAQALSSPFLLKNAKTISPTKHNSSFDEENSSVDSESQDGKVKNKFYDENVTFSFLGTIGEDIGVRICEQP